MQLHSRYNPHAEAARYIDSLKLKDTIKCFILIEPGLGYIIPVLRERYKESKIIALHIDDFPEQEKAVNCSIIPHVTEKTFAPLTEETQLMQCAQIQKFLETHVQEDNTDNIKIIEWRPSLNVYKDSYVKLLSQVLEFLKRADAGQRTTAVFGKRWFRNFFRNLENINKIILYMKSDIPVIVTGSGPGLEEAFPFIRKEQSRYLIIAASSSVPALSHNGIKPDIIITTDGTPWALWHLLCGIRNQRIRETGFAVSLCAAMPSQCADTPKLIINDGSLWQSVILHELAIPSVVIPQRGTVSATAAELAMMLSSGNIYLAGMDFSYNDIITHVKPYGFDSLFYGAAARFHPVYTELFTRSVLSREGGSMDIYAAWFKNQLISWPKRIFSITRGSNIFDYKNVLSLKQNKPEKIKNTDFIFNIENIKEDNKKKYPADSPRHFRKRGTQILLNAMENPEYKENLSRELKSLLFSGTSSDKTAVTDDELIMAIRGLSYD